MNALPKSIPKVLFRRLIDLGLRLRGTKLPPYFNAYHRLSYLACGLEPSVVRVASRILGRGDIAVDIGANVGFLTRRFASFVKGGGRVFAFEPDPSTFDYLKFNTRNLHEVLLFNIALSDRCGKTPFFLHPTSGMSNSLVNAWESSRAIEVETTTFDQWAAATGVARVKLIKIDVEGAEPFVLRGMHQTVSSSQKPHLIIEFCPNNLGGRDKEDEIFGFLADYGYTIYRIDSRGLPYRVAEASDVHGHLNDDGYVNLLASV